MSTKELNPDVLENDHFHLHGRLSAPNHYVEGITQLFFGYPFTKILLHTVIEPLSGDNPEIRKAEQFLSLPTVAAIEIANLILGSAKQSEEQLLKDLNENARDKVKSILSNYTSEVTFEGYDSEEIAQPSRKTPRIKK
jgi:hypothetical protein